MKPFQTSTYLLTLCLVLCLMLSGCKGEEEMKTIDFRGANIPALSMLADYSGKLDSVSIPAPASVDEDGNEIPAEEGPDTYVYHGLDHAGQTVSQYVDLLLEPEQDFHIVNAAGKSVPPPDYTEQEGFVVLNRANMKTLSSIRIVVSWMDKNCEIMVSELKAQPARASQEGNGGSPLGEVTRDTAVTSYGSSQGAPVNGAPPLPVEEVVGFFEAVSPSVLGLEGDSMDDYNIYYMDGKILVNGDACDRVRIYSLSEPEKSNAFVGTFLLSGGGRVYRHDLETDEMIELSLT